MPHEITPPRPAPMTHEVFSTSDNAFRAITLQRCEKCGLKGPRDRCSLGSLNQQFRQQLLFNSLYARLNIAFVIWMISGNYVKLVSGQRGPCRIRFRSHAGNDIWWYKIKRDLTPRYIELRVDPGAVRRRSHAFCFSWIGQGCIRFNEIRGIETLALFAVQRPNRVLLVSLNARMLLIN